MSVYVCVCAYGEHRCEAELFWFPFDLAFFMIGHSLRQCPDQELGPAFPCPLEPALLSLTAQGRLSLGVFWWPQGRGLGGAEVGRELGLSPTTWLTPQRP